MLTCIERAWQSYVKDCLVWRRFLCREGWLGCFLVFGGKYLGKRGEVERDMKRGLMVWALESYDYKIIFSLWKELHLFFFFFSAIQPSSEPTGFLGVWQKV